MSDRSNGVGSAGRGHLGGFAVVESAGSAHDFHHRSLDGISEPAIWIHRVGRPAIVLGSTQRDDVIDRAGAERAGYEVTGRRSGGGIVIVDPTTSCWIDVIVPRGHPRWDDDVTRAFSWVGEWWLDALHALGVPGLSVHRGPARASAHGRVVCFAGIGSGEVVVDAAGAPRKIVGLSQRRTRDVSRIQGLYLARWDPTPLRHHLAPGVLPADLDLDAVPAGLAAGSAAPLPGEVVDSMVATFPG